ncbi:hypothetical protein [Deefgea salmonis]|uniref:Type IV pilus modification protein PilV n=1 Tax=Deefgea salmonis TaxID=2875502 RepID=A0ABS8BML1_9NEIS|nr:hypothetical protein [Deefgea salmonis]MCB5196965.1 hypothetical protein [Deefgea salmonis]
MKQSNQSGTILLEVLISIVVLAFGILGLASLQAYSLRASHSSNLRSIASDLATTMAEQIQTNAPKQFDVPEPGNDAVYYNSDVKIPVAPDYAQLTCTYDSSASKYTCAEPTGFTKNTKTATFSQDLAKKEVADWLLLVKQSLPMGAEGGAVICKDDTPEDGTKPNGGTGCLAASSADYAAAPYVIKIWYEEQVAKTENTSGAATDDSDANDKQVRILKRFSTTISN